jgi:hypothetical protein
VEGNPTALAELRALGAPLVPAVAAGGRVVHGWNPRGYAELLGVSYAGPASLPPAELFRRLDGFLALTQRLVSAIPAERMGWTPPQRDRTLRDLAYHIFRLSLAFADGMDLGEVPEGWLQEKAPPALRDGPAIARYGALVRGRLAGWCEGAGPGEYARVIRVYSGPQSSHDLLERTTWHAAQHLRQLHALVQEIGVVPPEELPAVDFAGLPLPESLW